MRSRPTAPAAASCGRSSTGATRGTGSGRHGRRRSGPRRAVGAAVAPRATAATCPARCSYRAQWVAKPASASPPAAAEAGRRRRRRPRRGTGPRSARGRPAFSFRTCSRSIDPIGVEGPPGRRGRSRSTSPVAPGHLVEPEVDRDSGSSGWTGSRGWAARSPGMRGVERVEQGHARPQPLRPAGQPPEVGQVADPPALLRSGRRTAGPPSPRSTGPGGRGQRPGETMRRMLPAAVWADQPVVAEGQAGGQAVAGGSRAPSSVSRVQRTAGEGPPVARAQRPRGIVTAVAGAGSSPALRIASTMAAAVVGGRPRATRRCSCGSRGSMPHFCGSVMASDPGEAAARGD